MTGGRERAVEALATALRDADVGAQLGIHPIYVEEATGAIDNLPPGWRLVGPDMVVTTVDAVARMLYENGTVPPRSAWEECIPQWREHMRAEARRLLGQDGGAE